MKRRELLLGSSGIAAAFLSGRVPTAQAKRASGQQTIEIDTAIELLPAPSEFGVEYDRVTQVRVDAESEAELSYPASVISEFDEIEAADVDTVVTARSNESSLGAIVGSFDQPEPGEEVEDLGDWRVADDPADQQAVASMDGMLTFATASDADTRIDGAKAGAKVQISVYDAAIDEQDALKKALDRLGDNRLFFYIRDLRFSQSAVSDDLNSFSAGLEQSMRSIRGTDKTLENEYLLEKVEGADLDDEQVKKFIRELEQGKIVEFDIDHGDDFVFVNVVAEAPPERNREAAPDASLSMAGNPSEGTATIEHQSGSPIPADMLELWVNGELADVQPADEFDTFDTGDSLTVDTGSLASVYLRWFDEAENEYFEYVSQVVGSDLFETTYDPAAETIEISYTGESDIDPALLNLSHRKRIEQDDETVRLETEQLTEQIEELGERLTTGDSLVVEGVEVRDTVLLELDVPEKPAGGFGPNTTVVRERARQPRISIRRRPEKEPILTYYDDTARDAEDFRVLADGEEMETQPADEYDTLEEGDRVQLSDVEFGTKIVVEWTVGDEPTVVHEHVVTPQFYLETAYDDSEGILTMTHARGESVDAANLELMLDGDMADTQFADEFETVSQGDTLSVEVEPFTPVNVNYVGAETEESITREVTGRNLFRASYDTSAETVELVYTGEQDADTSNLTVRTYSRGAGVNNENPEPFADIETLSSGDSVTIEDVGPQTTITVAIEISEQSESETSVYSTTVFRFNVSPLRAFEFENDDGTVVATYRESATRNAEEFRFLADGNETDTQPSDEYDTLEEGDSIEVGSFEPGTTIVVEWPANGDASEVQEYTVVPSATFTASYDGDEGVLTVTHDGGDGIEAAKLSVYAPPATERPADWDGEGTVSEGDSTTVESEETPERVVVVYNQQRVVDRPELEE